MKICVTWKGHARGWWKCYYRYPRLDPSFGSSCNFACISPNFLQVDSKYMFHFFLFPENQLRYAPYPETHSCLDAPLTKLHRSYKSHPIWSSFNCLAYVDFYPTQGTHRDRRARCCQFACNRSNFPFLVSSDRYTSGCPWGNHKSQGEW